MKQIVKKVIMIKMIEECINYDKCSKVVRTLNRFYKNKCEISNIEYPKNLEYKSNKYFLYMFYSCLLDYGMRSKLYHKNLVETYKKYPNIFDPDYVVKMKEESLKCIIVNYIHPRYPNVAVGKWIELSKKLEQYDNILDYLKTINSFEELEYFIKGIKGYGQKTGGLLIRIICDANVCNFKDSIGSIPIDRHDIEISYLTGIINDKKIGNKDIKNLSDAYVKISKKMNINPSDIDKYLWEVGNSFCNKKECNECPLNSCCEGKKESDKNVTK